MQGLEQIRNKVIEQAESEARSLLAEAERHREKALEAFRAEEEQLKEELERELRESAEREEHRTRSTVILERRNALLRARRSLIDEVKAEALAQLAELPEHRRYGYIHAVVETYAKGGETILLNARDQALFERLAQASKVELKLSEEAAAIRGGVILLQGERRLDLSFDKVFETEDDALTEEIARDLWGEA